MITGRINLMDYLKRAIITTALGAAPLVIAAQINLHVRQAKLEQTQRDTKEEFLRVAKEIKEAIIRVEGRQIKNSAQK